jgi:hypothetical protein
MGGTPKEPTITQAPTKSPQQMQFLDSMLSFFSNATAGQTIGGGYGGPGQANYSPITMGEGKGGTTPVGNRPRDRRNPRGSPLDAALTGPIVAPFTQAQTGNYPGGRR